MAKDFFNPFSKYFLRGQPSAEREIQKQIEQNTQGITEQDPLYQKYYGRGAETGYIVRNKQNDHDHSMGDVYFAPIQFDQIFYNKKRRILKYREMANYPEINQGLDFVSDDSIVSQTNGNIVTLQFKEELTKLEERKIREQFNYIVYDVFRANEALWEMFRKWLVEGEIFVELILNDAKNSIIGIKSLPAWMTYPVFDGNRIAYYIQKLTAPSSTMNNVAGLADSDEKNKPIIFPAEQIAYCNYGVPGSSRSDIRGYLDPAIRTYNQLRSLEDAVVIYRLCRAPERRVWNIEIGRMPTGKAEEYIKKMINKYRRQINYNPSTGAIDSSLNVQSLSEDFWFPKREGAGSTVEPLPSGANLGELGDLEYFKEKLITSLKLPKSRSSDTSTTYQSGTNVQQEELKFFYFTSRLQKRFQKILMDAFMQQLKLQKFDSRLINRRLYDLRWTPSNYFKQFKEEQVLESNLNTFTTISSFIMSEENPDGYFSWEFVAKNWMHMDEEMWEKNQILKEKEKKIILDGMKFKSELIKARASIEGVTDINVQAGTSVNTGKSSDSKETIINTDKAGK